MNRCFEEIEPVNHRYITFNFNEVLFFVAFNIFTIEEALGRHPLVTVILLIYRNRIRE